MTSARCRECGGTTKRMDDLNRAAKRARRPKDVHPVSIDHLPGCSDYRARPPDLGEYVVMVRDSSVAPWRLCADDDPIPDRGDQATENSVLRAREHVARRNRTAGWYKYRTTYVAASSRTV